MNRREACLALAAIAALSGKDLPADDENANDPSKRMSSPAPKYFHTTVFRSPIRRTAGRCGGSSPAFSSQANT